MLKHKGDVMSVPVVMTFFFFLARKIRTARPRNVGQSRDSKRWRARTRRNDSTENIGKGANPDCPEKNKEFGSLWLALASWQLLAAKPTPKRSPIGCVFFFLCVTEKSNPHGPQA